MTRDASAQAVHERLEHLVATMPEPDVEAGWAALVAQLEPSVAPVVPLCRRRSSRAIVLGVAAAILIGGSALAMVGHEAEQSPPAAPSDSSTGGVTGPHNHAPFSGAPSTNGTSHHHVDGGKGPEHSGDGPKGHDGTGSSGTSTPTGEPSTPPRQDPSPTPDPGTGNQGDNSQGDNSQGDSSQGDNSQGDNSQGGSSGGSGSGGSSGGGSGSGGGDQGSNGQ